MSKRTDAAWARSVGIQRLKGWLKNKQYSGPRQKARWEKCLRAAKGGY